MTPGTPAGGARPPSDPSAALIGKQVGNFRITRLLGTGGMGAVYEAAHAVIGNRVAVKVLSGPLAQDRTLVERFFAEASAASHIQHQNIVQVSDLGQHPEGFYYCVMELLDGQPLQQLLAHGRPIPLEVAAPVVLQVCAALRAAHGKGIIHRDVKPANIMLLGQGPRFKVKLVDFGIARLAGSAIATPGQATVTGTVMGTPAYMSPEQAAGKVSEVDGRSDVYSLGVVMYEMAAGRHPFPARNMGELLIAHIQQKPPRPSLLAPSIAPRYESAIMRALEKEKRHRFPSAEALGHEVQEIWEEQRGGSLRAPTPAAGTAAVTPPAASAPRPSAVPTPQMQRPTPTPAATALPSAPPTAPPAAAATQHLAGAELAGGGVLVAAPARDAGLTPALAVARTAKEAGAAKRLARWPFLVLFIAALAAAVYITGAHQDPARAASRTWEALNAVIAEARAPETPPAPALEPAKVDRRFDLAAELVTKGPFALRQCWNALKNFRAVPLARAARSVQESVWMKTSLLKEFRRCADYAGAVGVGGSGEESRAPPWMVLYLDGRATLEWARELKGLEPKRLREARKHEEGDPAGAAQRAVDSLSDAIAMQPDPEHLAYVEADWGAARLLLREVKGN